MTERSRFWDGGTVGDATVSPYDAATEFSQVLMALTGAIQLANLGGVFKSSLNGLAPSNPSGVTIRVASGRAQVYGTWYENDSNVDTTITLPSVSTRIDRFVLRKDWTLQTVRVTRIAGVEGGGAPALVQSPGVTWDIPICQVSVTTGGTITITDQRQYLDVALLNQANVFAGGATFGGAVDAGANHVAGSRGVWSSDQSAGQYNNAAGQARWLAGPRSDLAGNADNFGFYPYATLPQLGFRIDQAPRFGMQGMFAKGVYIPAAAMEPYHTGGPVDVYQTAGDNIRWEKKITNTGSLFFDTPIPLAVVPNMIFRFYLYWYGGTGSNTWRISASRMAEGDSPNEARVALVDVIEVGSANLVVTEATWNVGATDYGKSLFNWALERIAGSGDAFVRGLYIDMGSG